jgi:hypothetical protein
MRVAYVKWLRHAVADGVLAVGFVGGAHRLSVTGD